MRFLWPTLLGGFVAVVAFSALWVSVWHTNRAAWFGAGLLDGSFHVAVMWLISWRSYNVTVGAWAEQWTSGVLHKQHGWRTINGIPQDRFDIDHVVFAPGGVLAVETKYYGSSGGREWSAKRLVNDIEQARRNAASTRSLLRAHSGGRAYAVTPVLALWGVGVPGDFETHQRDGVWIVDGNDLKTFLRRFDATSPEEQPDSETIERLREYVDTRDRYDDSRIPRRVQLNAPAHRPGSTSNVGGP